MPSCLGSPHLSRGLLDKGHHNRIAPGAGQYLSSVSMVTCATSMQPPTVKAKVSSCNERPGFCVGLDLLSFNKGSNSHLGTI
jgi:hypothetical protein